VILHWYGLSSNSVDMRTQIIEECLNMPRRLKSTKCIRWRCTAHHTRRRFAVKFQSQTYHWNNGNAENVLDGA